MRTFTTSQGPYLERLQNQHQHYRAFCCFPQISHPAGWSPCDFPYWNVSHSPPSTRTDFHQKPGRAEQTPSLYPSWSHQIAGPLSGRPSGARSAHCTYPNQKEGELWGKDLLTLLYAQFVAFQPPFSIPASPHLKQPVLPHKYSCWRAPATEAQEQELYMLF